VYNIQKAVSRLDFAPKLKEIEVTDFQKGLGVFTPKPDKPVSFDALKQTLKKAGYTLDAADITVSGKLVKDGEGWSIVVQPSGQRFVLTGANVDQTVAGAADGSTIEVTGDWKTSSKGSGAYETISPSQSRVSSRRSEFDDVGYFINASFTEEGTPELFSPGSAPPAAPIRVTSPGLTVYKGGAVTPRIYLIKQHFESLEVNRQVVDVSVSYTPSPVFNWRSKYHSREPLTITTSLPALVQASATLRDGPSIDSSEKLKHTVTGRQPFVSVWSCQQGSRRLQSSRNLLYLRLSDNN
jgi:hypothetical protein